MTRPTRLMPIGSVEMQEYLVAANLVAGITNQNDEQRLQNLRECFRFQRFAVMNWLMINGISIPFDLLSDQTHPKPGNQLPDTGQNIAHRMGEIVKGDS